MKTECDEISKCLEIKRRIQLLNKSKNAEIKIDLINKYITKIIDVKQYRGRDIIFFEYIEGYDLKDYLIKNKLNSNELNKLYLQSLISVKVFHRLLNLSHRDLKLENLFYDMKNKTVKIIDYGFICDRNDKDCYNVYQGTAKYTHLSMNKIGALKYSKKKNYNNSGINSSNNLNSNTQKNSGFAKSTSIKTSKKKYNFPDSVSQDLFSLIIILFKIYYIQKPKIELKDKEYSSNKKVYKIIEEYENSFSKRKRKKNKDKYLEKKQRYRNKKNLLKKLFEVNISDVDNQLIFVVINILKNYWNPKNNNFQLNNIKSESVSIFIYDMLIYNSLMFIKEHTIANEWKNLVRL